MGVCTKCSNQIEHRECGPISNPEYLVETASLCVGRLQRRWPGERAAGRCIICQTPPAGALLPCCARTGVRLLRLCLRKRQGGCMGWIKGHGTKWQGHRASSDWHRALLPMHPAFEFDNLLSPQPHINSPDLSWSPPCVAAHKYAGL